MLLNVDLYVIVHVFAQADQVAPSGAMMPKRRYDDTELLANLERPPKRARSNIIDRLSVLSDELLLRTLSFLPISDLVFCEQLSRRLKSLATDGQIWKSLYYDRFVKPRASRIPGIRSQKDSPEKLHYSSRIANWLNDERLVKDGATTDWKKQYKLRHNWSRGSARVTETEVAENPSTPPLLIRLHDRWLFITDKKHGLRAWDTKGGPSCVAHYQLRAFYLKESVGPTSMAMDTGALITDTVNLVVGFGDGSFSIYAFMSKHRTIAHLYTHPPSSTGSIAAVAYSFPHLATMNGEPKLSLYVLEQDHDTDMLGTFATPRLLSSLRSYSVYPPLSLALRMSASGITASIAYAIPNLLNKWLVGIQELRIASDGTILDSRVASAATEQIFPNTGVAADGNDPCNAIGWSPLQSGRRPSSLSYNHPYLLTAHPNNTLTLYVVTSTEDDLSVSSGTVLWGHTSAISGAHVGDRGKAVSISSKGNELRVWELEGRGQSNSLRRRKPPEHASVQVRPASKDEQNVSSSWRPNERLTGVSKGWIAFDEEKVVLLQEKTHGAQAVIVYDFT